MKRTVYLGIGDGGLWLALIGEPIPPGATVLDPKDGKFWLRRSVPPMAHPNILHAVSDIAEGAGYPFHGAMAFADLPFVMDTLAEAIDQRRLVAYRAINLEGGGKGPAPQPQPGPKPPAPAPTPVNPLIDPPVAVVVVQKKAKNPKTNAEEAYTHPKRQSFTLKTDAAFDGTATFTCDKADKVKFFSAAKDGTEIKFDGTANVFKPNAAPAWAPKGSTISSGVTVFVEAVKPSDKKEDITIKLALSGGSKPTGPDDTSKITSVEVTLDIHKSMPDAASAPAFSKDDKVFVGRHLLVQDKANHFLRGKLVIQQVKPSDFEGDLVLKAKDGHVDAFKEQDATKAGQATALPFTIKANKVAAAGEILWAQGASASAKMMDSGFILGIKGIEDEADKVTVTAVEIKLDICQSRTKAQAAKKPAEDPSPMTDEDKVKKGRFVHEQAGKHHGRALLVVRKVKPEKFDGTLRLEALPGGRTELYDKELATDGGTLIAAPKDFDLKAEKNEDKKLWVQGKTVSAALRDAGYFLHLKDDPPKNADTVLVTVCKFTDLEADIPSTPARTNRYGNNPVARHPFKITGASADHFDEDPTKNIPFALVEDSIRNTDPIKLKVKVAPAGTPVLWDIVRDTRPGKGDHADIVKLPGPPAHAADRAAAADALKREMQANGAGTFHIRPFVDCNGSGRYEQHADLEPSILMITVLIRVQGHTNTSVKNDGAGNAGAFVRGGAGGVPTSATGVNVRTGHFANGANDAVHQIATATVIGGGPAGKLGLDQLFGGWMNCETDTGAVGEDAVATYVHNRPPLPNPLGGPPIPQPPVNRQRISVRVNPAQGGTVFLPAGPAAPAAWDMGPVLDVTNYGAEGTGGNRVVGTEGAIGPPKAIVKTAIPVGERWTIEMWDSPGDGAPVAHGGYAPTRLIAYRFNIDFRTDLVFWTNTSKSAAATGANEPAHRLYSSVQTNTWSIRCALTFDAAGNAVAPVPARATVTIVKDGDPKRRATPCDGMACETRGPCVLNMLATDARN